MAMLNKSERGGVSVHHGDLKDQHGVTTDTALRLSRYFGTTPHLWLNLQKTFELCVAEIESGKDTADRVHPRAQAQVSGPNEPMADRG